MQMITLTQQPETSGNFNNMAPRGEGAKEGRKKKERPQEGEEETSGREWESTRTES